MFIFFLLSQSAQSAVSLFLTSLCPSIYGAAFKRMFTSRCLCTFCLLAFARSPLQNFKLVSICSEGAITSLLLWTAHLTFPIQGWLLLGVSAKRKSEKCENFRFFCEISFHSVSRKIKCEKIMRKFPKKILENFAKK